MVWKCLGNRKMHVCMAFFSMKITGNSIEISPVIHAASMRLNGGCMTQDASLGCFKARVFVVFSLEFLYFVILDLFSLILLFFL